MKIIVGLGNPGEKYKNTRHNAGFLAIDKLAEEENLDWQFNKKFSGEICKNNDFVFLKPMTFMNNSGQSVQALMSFYSLLPKKMGLVREKNSDLSEILTVIHDDKDIELGKIKESVDSRSAGHNGVQSIIDHLKTKNFKRIRIGIKNDGLEKRPAEKFVLEKFSKEEMELINKIIKIKI